MLHVENIQIEYKKNIVLRDCSFSLAPGECIGLLGINGSGKSSMLRCIAGLKAPSVGRITFNNTDISTDLKAYQKKLGFVTQENPLIEELTGRDNLKLFTSMNNEELNSFVNSPLISLLGVYDFLDKKVKALSGGMKKRLSIVSTIMNKPSYLLLDEPFAALDMIAKEDIKTYIKSFVSAGGAVIIASHDESLFKLCNRVYVLKNNTMTDISKLPPNLSLTDFLRN